MYTGPLCAALLLSIILWRSYRSQALRRLPPFVPGLPLIGNLLQTYPLNHLTLQRWQEKMGPIYSLDIAGQIVVVLADVKTATEVLDSMAVATSGRAPFIMGLRFMTKYLFFATVPYGEKWRRHRRAAHEVIHARASEAFLSVQQDEACRLIKGLLSQEDAYVDYHITRAATSTVWRALYGGPSLGLAGDNTLETVNEIIATTFAGFRPGGSLIDIIPALAYIPEVISPFRKYAKSFHRRADAFFRGIFRDGCDRATMSADVDHLNSAAALHERRDQLGLGEKDMAWLCGMLFTAGAEATSTTLMYFILAMVLHPEAMRKAHQELDAVVGDTPPTFDDQERLPYIGAIIRETMRWRTVGPLGVPHATTDEIVHGEYVIPRDTIIIPLMWSISRDPAIYPDYDVFRPERFLDSNDPSMLKLVTKDGGRYSDFAFGFGRRVCVGREVALSSLYIDAAMLLWAFRFEKARDANGVETVPSSTDFHDSGVTVSPAPFPCKLVPRSARVRELFGSYGDDEAR